ncbi:MAG: DUF2974 domain-containing protein [Ruminococcus sp.]|nr:DUF2974 domain-containing protein [Ruminococcus sp.]
MSDKLYGDYELCVLEHIIYMRGDEDIKSMKIKGGNPYKPLEDCKDVGEYVDQFDIKDFQNADVSQITSGGEQISKNEYAAVIAYMQDPLKSSKIRALQLNRAMKLDGDAVSAESMHSLPDNEKNYKVLAYDLTDPDSDEHVVVFKGTEGGQEWKDNVEGLGKEDTPAQIDAYNFVDSIEGKDNITVVGHSKGGNKAMYCTIRCDNIKKCVAMDGQGFSDEFMRKYDKQIVKKASKIKNISYCSDYVHPLMRAIPGSTQLYTGSGYGSNGVGSIGECHSPNSILTYTTYKNGKLILTGEFNYTSETDSIKLIRGFVDYIMYSDCEDKNGVIEYLAHIVGQVGGNKDDFFKALKNGDEEILDTDKLTTVIAYLIKYCNDNNINGKQLAKLLKDIHLWDVIIDFIPDFIPDSVLGPVSGYIFKENEDIIVTEAIDKLLMYFKLNEKDQNYFIPNAITSLAFLFNRDVDVSYFGGVLPTFNINWKKSNNKDAEKWIKLSAGILSKIKSKYESIRPNIKTPYTPKVLENITVLSDWREATSPMTHYNLQGIQKSISMMKKALEINSVNLSDTVLAGKTYESFRNISEFYDTLHNNVYELIQNTIQQTESVYNAVIELENQ